MARAKPTDRVTPSPRKVDPTARHQALEDLSEFVAIGETGVEEPISFAGESPEFLALEDVGDSACEQDLRSFAAVTILPQARYSNATCHP